MFLCFTYHREFHVAVVPPPLAPTVTKDPVASWYVHTDNVHRMVHVVISGAFCENTASVVAHVVRIQRDGEGASC